MATRSRRSRVAAKEPSPVPESDHEPEPEPEREHDEDEDEDEDEAGDAQSQDGARALTFNKQLTSRPGRPVGVGDLLKRLKELWEEARHIPQEDAVRDSILPVAQELAVPSLLGHKDAGVRAWTASCLVEIFRLCAPDAPYTPSKLKDIFNLIISKILFSLSNPSHPYNSQHLYVLRSLAEWKSILLINEIPGSNQLTLSLFTTCFDVVSGPSKAENGEELSKNVEHNMTAVLEAIIDEAPLVSNDVVEVIMAQFLWADPVSLGSSGKGKKAAPVDAKQSTLRRKEAPPSYNMAKNVCNAFPDKMARLVGTYFSTVIVSFASGNGLSKTDESDDEAPKGPSEEDINDARKVHSLLRELWRSCPGVVQEIVPSLQDELGTDNLDLRQLATETFGDMISGIGSAGPPPPPELDPVAYPSQSLGSAESFRPYDFLTTPASINSFPTQYPAAYHSFMQRKHDKSPVIRAVWTTAIGRILMTSAGGVGLDQEEEQRLLKCFAECLIDADERVRLAAVRAIEHFDFSGIVRKLGSSGDMSQPGSILSNLADRVKDKKSVIHSESMKLLGRIWGVASGAIAEGNEKITQLLGPIPSRILDACYVNDREINLLVDLTLYEALLPLSFPPIKAKPVANGASQVVKDSQMNNEQGFTEADIDKIRTERLLVLVNGLEERARRVFFVKQGNQAPNATYLERFLKVCEAYNGGVMDEKEKETKAMLEGLINFYGKTHPESTRVIENLWKFAKDHDRRSYQLIRFCIDPESDYRRVFKSIKELRKRTEDKYGNSTLFSILTPLLYQASLLCYNKSHLPFIMEYARTDENGLGAVAHEVLKEVSTKQAKVFSTHVKDLCKTLESEAPTDKDPNPAGAVDVLKACAAFAKKFPKDIPLNAANSRRLVQSFLDFARYGNPPQAAKHAITIIMSSANKKQMHATNLLTTSMKDFEYGCDHWLTKLAALSQLVLLSPSECEDSIDPIVEIAVNRILLKAHPVTPETEVQWMEIPDDDMVARTWALRILVNRLRSFPAEADIKDASDPIYKMLNRMVKEGGETSKKNNTPLGHKNRQRLLGANFLLKLSCHRRLDGLLDTAAFNELALVTHDPCEQVRKGFANKLMKYLGQNRLPPRYYTVLFFLAHDPDESLKDTTTTWLRSRRVAFAARKETVFEQSFARLLSLIAHHPDFANDNETLKLMSEYILYYLKAVATPDNLSLIYHVAQRVKGVADGIRPSAEADENLYILSDLAQAIIRIWEEQNSWTLQSWPGKLKLPSGIFKPLESHARAQEIADKQWIDEDLPEELESIVRRTIRGKKRRATDGMEKPRKKVKSEKAPKKEKIKSERVTKTPRKSRKRGDDDDDVIDIEAPLAPPSEPRRKSDRRSNAKSYVEVSSDEDEEAAEAEEEEQEEEADEGSPEANEDSPAPEEDVEMADEGDEAAEASAPEPEVEEEAELSEPEPEPPRKRGRPARDKKKTNGVSSSPETRKSAKPAKRSTASKAKSPAAAKTPVKRGAKLNGHVAAASSSPGANGTGSIRRSGRNRG